MGEKTKYDTIEDTFSITMELERPLIVDEIKKYSEIENKKKKQNKIKKNIKIGTIILITIILITTLININKIYEPNDTAKSALFSDNSIIVDKKDDYISFTPENKKITKGFIFYPGSNISPKAYAPLCREISSAGYKVAIIKEPFNIPFLGKNRAKDVIEDNPNITHWVVGGHSQGGVISCDFAIENNIVDGVVLISSYPMNDKLKNMTKDVISIWGSKDGVVNFEELVKSKEKLPKKTTYIEIEGANHSQFGDYGLQKGDNEALISEKEQTDITAKNIIKFLNNIN